MREAISDRNDSSQISSGGDYLPQAHGKWRQPTLFVDGHASITWYPVVISGTPHSTGVLQIDPSGTNGWGMGSLGWMDVP
jgi:hypothetical protein